MILDGVSRALSWGHYVDIMPPVGPHVGDTRGPGMAAGKGITPG